MRRAKSYRYVLFWVALAAIATINIAAAVHPSV